jgi:hypothetical protein
VIKVSILDQIKAALEGNNILSRLNQLEAWKNQAQPNIMNNINNITNISNNLTNNVVPAINKAKSDIQENVALVQEAATTAVNASNLANEAKGIVETIKGSVDEAYIRAEEAARQAETAVNNTQDFLNRLQVAASGVKRDIDNLSASASVLITTIIQEFTGIAEQFKVLGDRMVLESGKISKEGVDIGKTILKNTTDIGKKMSYIKNNWLDELPTSASDLVRLASAPWNLTMALTQTLFVLEFQKAFLPSMTGITTTLKNASLMKIVNDGFDDLGKELDDFGKALVGLGNGLAEEAQKIWERIQLAQETIQGAFNGFINAFTKIFHNLQFTLAGETVP